MLLVGGWGEGWACLHIDLSLPLFGAWPPLTHWKTAWHFVEMLAKLANPGWLYRGNVLEIQDKGHFFLSSQGNKTPYLPLSQCPWSCLCFRDEAFLVSLPPLPHHSHQTLPLLCGRSHTKDSPGLSSAYTSAKSLSKVEVYWPLSGQMTLVSILSTTSWMFSWVRGREHFPSLSNGLEPLLIREKGLGSSQVCLVS